MQRTRECDPQTAKWGHKLDQEINNLKELEIRDEILCGREGHEFHLLSRNPQRLPAAAGMLHWENTCSAAC
jgi:hypothetical protein